MPNPLHELVLRSDQEDLRDQRKVGLYHLSGKNEQMKALRVIRYGQADAFWDYAYLFPHESTGSTYMHPGFEGQFFAVVPAGLDLLTGSLTVHETPLDDEAQSRMARRVMLSCRTRTTFYWGGELKAIAYRLKDLWPELKDETKRQELLERNIRRYLFPYRVDDYRPNDPGLLDELPEAQGCQKFGTRVVQVVNPKVFKEAELVGWTINYLCPEHSSLYMNRVRERESIRDEDINNGVAQIGQGHHSRNGTWMNTDHVFPSRVHVMDSVKNLLLTFEQRAMFRASYALQADGTPRNF